MSFHYVRKKSNPFTQKKYKKKDSLQTSQQVSAPVDTEAVTDKGRMSLFTFLHGSLTLETALVLPLFLFAVLSVMSFMEVIRLQAVIGGAAAQVSKDLAKAAYLYGLTDADMDNPGGQIIAGGFSQLYAKDLLVEYADAGYLNQSIINGQSGGISLLRSGIMRGNDVIDLIVDYRIKLPFNFFLLPDYGIVQRGRCRAWTGYGESDGSDQAEDMVYVTVTGTVYHRSSSCSHIDLSIRTAAMDEIDTLRNEQSERYRPCEKCRPGSMGYGQVYITGSGNRYHKTLDCSGLKRGIRKIPISEAGSRGPCSRCGGAG